MDRLDMITGYDFLKKLKEQSDKSVVHYDQLFDLLERKARAKGIPLVGQFELTPLCNFDCKMCYSHLSKDQMQHKPLLSVRQWKQIADGAFKAGLMRVILTGGECLTYPGFKELYLYLRSLGCEVKVLTNGSLLDDDWIRFFSEHPPMAIKISLYGCDEETYERVTRHRMFSVVSTNIRKLINAKIPVSLAITPSRYMGKDILDIIRTAHTFGVPYSITPFLIEPKEETRRNGHDHELSLNDYIEACKLKNKLDGKEILSINVDLLPPPGGPHHKCNFSGLACGGGRSYFDVDWDGSMYICNSIRSVVGYPLREGFQSSWNKLHNIALSWNRVPECIDCPYESLCTICEIRKFKFGISGQEAPLVQCKQTQDLVQHGLCVINEHI